MRGITKAPVLPEPVRAMPTTSTPCKISGMVLRWMGVGSWNPLRLIAFSTGMLSPMDSARGGVGWGCQFISDQMKCESVLCDHIPSL